MANGLPCLSELAKPQNEHVTMTVRRKILISLFFLSLAQVTIGQTVADFVADNVVGCDFANINFTNLSTDGGNPINCTGDFSYQWDFGTDTGNECSTGNIYSQPGSYTVCLTVTNNTTGEVNQECKVDYITILPLPEPSFTFPVQNGCAPLEVCFTNTTTITSGSLVDCLWDFADGTVVNDCSDVVCHTFQQGADFNVSLTVLDDNGCPPVTFSDLVSITANPIADFTPSNTFSCVPPLTVDYTNNDISPDVTYVWAFEGGDITNFTGPTPPPVTYAGTGNFDVSLTAIDNNSGCSSTSAITELIAIGNSIGFSLSSYDICLGDTLFLFDESEGNPTGWNWDFGDGMGVSIQQNPFYVFTTPGCFDITLETFSQLCNGTFTDPQCVTVVDQPTGTVDNDNPLGCELPHVVNFTSNIVGNAQSFDWVFGDSLGLSDQENPTFTFNEFGEHVVLLNVTTEEGCTLVLTDTILIQPIDVNLAGTAVEGCVPLTVTLNENSNTVAPIVDWLWEIEGIGTFTEENPTVVASDTGVYDVVLTVVNDFGCTATDTFPAYIQTGVPPDVDFEATPLITCIDTVVGFTYISDVFVDGWIWDFGDGSPPSFEPNPTHEYVDTGFMTVCLTLFQNGCPNTHCKEDYLYLIPPKAAFQVAHNCDDPYTVDFEDFSLGADSIIYDFGIPGTDDDTSTLANPTFTFPDTGVYTVTQTVFNFETGCMEDAMVTVNVTDPEAIFTIPDSVGCVPFTVNPDDQSVSAVAWEWTSVNGSIDNPNNQSPSVTYSDVGVFDDLILVVTDINGCTDTLQTPDSVFVNQVIADFTISDPSGCVPFEVNFQDNSTNALFDNIQWTWSFGDGSSVTGQDVFNTYETADTFTVILSVTDEIGCSDFHVYPDTIISTLAIASFTGDTIACTEQVLTWTNTSVGSGLTYEWSFGDGTTSTDINASHSYDAEGSYDLCLTATDLNGCDSTVCRIVNVLDPVSDFVADTTFTFCPPLVVNFSNLSQNGVSGGYTWDFGDNTGLSNADEPAHVYTTAGSFDVTLISTSPSGCRDTLVFEDYIQLLGPQGDFFFDQDTGCVPLTVTFFTSSQSPVLHIMDYGNGLIDSSDVVVANDTFTFTYTQVGDYSPSLVLVDDVGCDQVFDSPEVIAVEDLNIDFVATDTILCDGGITNFNSLINSSETPTLIEWTFEGQAPPTSNAINPTNVVYNNFGEYDVQLIVSNDICTDTLIKPDYIAVDPIPQAAFTPNPNPDCEPSTITFTDNSTIGTNTIANWAWDFGDGEEAFNQNPTHDYPLEGDYDVKLVVSSQNGCLDSTIQTVNILPTPIVETQPGGTICIGESFQLIAAITANPGGATIAWDNAATLSCTDCLTPLASPIVTTTYTVTATSQSGCFTTAQVTVEVTPFPVPDINLNQDTTICEGTVIQLFAEGGVDVNSYDWDDSRPGLSCYNCPNPFATPLSSTTYVVTVTGEGGCMSTDSVTVSLFDPTQDFAGPDRTICQGDAATLSYNGTGIEPSWTPTTGLSCSFCPNPEASPSVTTVYTITVLDPQVGCEITDTLVVTVIPQGSVDAGPDDSTCNGDPITLNGTAFGTISWSPAVSLDDPNSLTPNASPTTTTTYTLTAVNDVCVQTDTVVISVLDSAEVFAPDIEICLGDTAFLLATGLADSYSWSPSTGLSDPNDPNPAVFVTQDTEYTVTASLGSCPSATDVARVTVNGLPSASLLPYHEFYLGQPVQLNVVIEGNVPYAYAWTPTTDLSCSACPSPAATPDTNRVYTVTVTDLETGCETVLQTELRELETCTPDIIHVPNGFTPNNDGNNDVLYVRSTALTEIRVFRVFNRWGELVFETNTINEGWDGTHNGKTLNPGVFVYYVEGVCPLDGSNLIQKGNVTLIR